MRSTWRVVLNCSFPDSQYISDDEVPKVLVSVELADGVICNLAVAEIKIFRTAYVPI